MPWVMNKMTGDIMWMDDADPRLAMQGGEWSIMEGSGGAGNWRGPVNPQYGQYGGTGNPLNPYWAREPWYARQLNLPSQKRWQTWQDIRKGTPQEQIEQLGQWGKGVWGNELRQGTAQYETEGGGQANLKWQGPLLYQGAPVKNMVQNMPPWLANVMRYRQGLQRREELKTPKGGGGNMGAQRWGTQPIVWRP